MSSSSPSEIVMRWFRPFTVCLALATANAAEARVERIVIDAVTPDGPGYERITGSVYGALDPSDPLNAVIQDLALAPRNADGMVEYTTQFRISRPVDGGSGILLYDVVNRGNPIADFIFGPTILGINSVPRERGYIIVWSGWQGDLLEDPNRLNIQVPVATDEGRTITGQVRTEYIVNAPTSTQNLSSGAFTGLTHRSYEPVSLDTAEASLTRRVREGDDRLPVDSADWAYADCSSVAFPGVPSSTQICLRDGFDPNYIYELVYTAKDPLVLGIGFAATRDLVSFLKHAAADDAGTPNPVASAVTTALLHGTSQSGRYARSLIDLGFNEDEEGRIVFEGANPHIAPGRIPLNVRFGQPGRAYGQHEDHLFPAYESPFAWNPIRDPVAGRTSGLLDRCRRTETCPKIIWTVSSTEYWQGRASLDTADALGRHDLGLPGHVRMYLFSSSQHVGAFAPALGICQQLSNPNQYLPNLRALLVALEEWVVDGIQPPKSRIPTLRQRTLVSSERSAIGWPDIPGVKYTGLLNELTLLDFGPDFDDRNISGVIAEPTQVVADANYAVLVPKVDQDGNEIAGIRSTTIQAPLGTYAGWNLRRAGFAQDELCGLTGTFVPFAETEAERRASGDPRLSLEERYGDHAGYVAAVAKAAGDLLRQGFLLPEDAERAIAAAEASDVLK